MWVVPTLHPAFLIRGGGQHTDAVIADLARAMRIVHFGAPQVDEGELLPNPTLSQIILWIDQTLKAQCRIAVDVENEPINRIVAPLTHVGLARGYDNDPRAPDKSAICIWFVRRDTSRVYTWGAEQEICDSLNELLANELVNKVMQNGQHDCDVLISHGYTVRGFTDDTMILHQCLEPEAPHGLDYLASIYTDRPRWKDELKGLGGLATADEQEVILYNLADTAATLEIYGKLKPRLSRPLAKSRMRLDVTPLYIQKMATQDIARRMSAGGMPVSMARYEEAREYWGYFNSGKGEWTGRIGEALTEMQRLVGDEHLDPHKASHLNWAVYKHFGAPIIRRTKSGTKNALDAATIAKVRPYVGPDGKQFIDRLLEWKSASKIESTYLRPSWRDRKGRVHGLEILHDGCVHTSFSVTIPPTDRWSSSSPNLQNWPEGNGPDDPANLRRIVEAPEGFEFVGMDFSQLELHIPAYESQDEVLCELFAEDLRLRWLGVSKEGRPDVYRNAAAACFECVEDQVSKLMRQTSKRIVLGGNYGAGAQKQLDTMRNDALDAGDRQMIRAAFSTTKRQVKLMNLALQRRWHGLTAWRRRLVRDGIDVARAGIGSTPGLNLDAVQMYPETGRFGRFLKGRCPHGSWSRGEDERADPSVTELLNRPVQTRASIILNDTTIDLDRDLRAGRFGEWSEEKERRGKCSRLVLTVHDEIITLVPSKWVGEMMMAMQEHGEKPRGPREDVYPVDVRAGRYWGDL